jgi:TolB-like protein
VSASEVHEPAVGRPCDRVERHPSRGADLRELPRRVGFCDSRLQSTTTRREQGADDRVRRLPGCAFSLRFLRPSGQAPVPAQPDCPRTAIAVLPFQNPSVGGRYAYFASGLHDEVLTQLAKVGSLRPTSRTSVMAYQGTAKPLIQIAEELKVGTLVEGSVQVVGSRLRVIVRVVDPLTNRPLRSETYDRTLDDAFAIESALAHQIVVAVGAALTSSEREGLAAAPTGSADACRFESQERL